MSKNTFKTNIAIPPGESLKEILSMRKMSRLELAERTGLTVDIIDGILQGTELLTCEIAGKLSDIFGMSAEYWNNKERRYRELL